MSVSKRITRSFKSRFVLTVAAVDCIPVPCARMAEKMVAYMMSTEKHDIRELERVLMDEFEEFLVMHHEPKFDLNLRWRVLVKQHDPPFGERYVVGLYHGKNRLVCSVAEPCNFQGRKKK